MLRIADAPSSLETPPCASTGTPAYYVYDLGAEWVEMTGLPMVFAVWAARQGVVSPEVAEAFRESCRYGRARIQEIVASEAPRRGFPPEFVEEYLTRRIVNQLGRANTRG